jgi:hypothetical protein
VCPHSYRRAATDEDDPRAVSVCMLVTGTDDNGQPIICGAQFDSQQEIIEDV